MRFHKALEPELQHFEHICARGVQLCYARFCGWRKRQFRCFVAAKRYLECSRHRKRDDVLEHKCFFLVSVMIVYTKLHH
jgi:hypothetical protein